MSDYNEKRDVFKWCMVALVIILIFTAVGYALRPIDKMVERAVLVNSHQYIEGMAQRGAILEASLAEINARLSMGVDEVTKRNLLAQRATLNVQLSAMRRMNR